MVTNETVETVINITNNTYITNLIGMWASILILFIGITYFTKGKNADMGKFWLKLLIVAIVSGLLLLALYLKPSLIIGVWEGFKSFLNIE